MTPTALQNISMKTNMTTASNKIWFKRHYFLEKIGDACDGTWYKMGADDLVWPFYFTYDKDEDVSATAVDFDGGPYLNVGDVFPVIERKILSIDMKSMLIKLENNDIQH